ncbi:MAG: radical SAM family heme chaperone HemW [Pseudomonadota bacterium]
MITPQPIALYIHIPWCVKKCPYCDFNSHQQKDELPESEYISHLIADLQKDLAAIDYEKNPRPISSIFIGGGTPSLFSPESIASLLSSIKSKTLIADGVEITMEANPGTFEKERFQGFADADVNRLSLGVQSYDPAHLINLGRIHDGQQAKNAVSHASRLDVRSFNTDIMHGLQGQSIHQALNDLKTSIDLNAPHISWYQLTIEPNTQFYSKPPELPNEDVLWEIQEQGQSLLAEAGYQQYEISAYCKGSHESLHNLNYWRFGDYLGIGCGAHGKLTDSQTLTIRRTTKIKHPKGYMDLRREYMDTVMPVTADELPFEFFMNKFRLMEPCLKTDYETVTGGQHLPKHSYSALAQLAEKQLIVEDDISWRVTSKGHRYLNDVLAALM